MKAIVQSPEIPQSSQSLRSPVSGVIGWACFLVAAVLLLLVQPYAAGYGDYRKTLFATIAQRWADPTWQHGALALPISIFFLWHRREKIAGVPVAPSVWGLVLVIFSAFLYYVGYKGNNYYFGFASVQCMVAGVCLWLWGWARFKACFFPWLVLGFAWPLIFLEESLGFHLRLVMVKASSGLLEWLGVGVVREGTTLISAPNPEKGRALGAIFSLNVEGACSGMRSLFALLMVGAIFSYVKQPTFWRRIFLFLWSFPLAILANLTRIMILLGASAVFGQAFAVGDEQKETSNFHFLSGIVVFMVALLGLQAISSLFSRIWRRKRVTKTSITV
jgi:exosortase